MLRDFPSFHWKILASSGSIAFTNSVFFMAPMDWFWEGLADGVKPPSKSSNALDDTRGLTPPAPALLAGSEKKDRL